jgi:Family of unknown function (DUF6459)
MSSDPAAPATAQHMPGEPAAGTLSCAPVVLPLVPGFVRPPAERRPLPDAVAVRMLAIPDSAPPYDDELTAGQRPGLASDGPRPAAGPRPGGGPLPGNGPRRGGGPLPGKVPGRSGQVSPGEQVPPGGRRAHERAPAAAGSPARGPAAPPGWPSQFAQVLAETLAGSRPPRQITPWTTERARRHIQRLGPLLAAGEQPRVRRVVTYRPSADVVEMTVIVGIGPKVRALAIRLERDGPRRASPGRAAHGARWVAVAVEAA